MSNNQGVSYKRDYEIPPESTNVKLPVLATKLERMVERLKDAEDNCYFYYSAAWTLVGISATSFFSVLGLTSTSTELPTHVEAIFWASFVLAAVVAGVTFKYSSTHRSDREEIRRYVIEDLEGVKERYEYDEVNG